LGGCKLSSTLEKVLYLASRQKLLEKISLDDARFIPALSGGISLREISLCIASSTWKDYSFFKPLCQALKESTKNLECLRIRNWTYHAPNTEEDVYRNHIGKIANTTSWDEGLDDLLDAIMGKESTQHLQIQVLERFTMKQKYLLQQILCHHQCRISKLDLRIHEAEDKVTASIQEWLLPGIMRNIHLKWFHLSGWRLSLQDTKYLLEALSCSHHLESFKFDRSQLECDCNKFVVELLQLGFLKSISSYNKVYSQKGKKNLDIDQDLLTAIRQNKSVESLKLKDMNVSTATVNKLLTLIGSSCPNIKFLKIVNLPQQSKPDKSDVDFLAPLDCYHLQQLHLMGFRPFASKRRHFSLQEDRRTWFKNALQRNPHLYRFGPGESYGLTQYLTDVDSPLLHLADLNRFGRSFAGKPKYQAIWPLIFEIVNKHLHQDPPRQASVIYGLISNGYLASC
jgi:hypothetical protein